MSRPSVKRSRSLTLMLVAVLSLGCSFGLKHPGLFEPSMAEAGQASFPDLVVSSVSNPPASAIAGTSFFVTDTTGNSGTATADPSTTQYRLSSDSTITTSDSLLTGTRSVPTLKKGSSSSGTVSVTVPAGQAPGTYYLGACADDLAIITESSETNNCRASTTTIVVSGPASISNLSPPSGPIGIPVTINGSNFSATQGTSIVRFNGVTATPTNWSATAITAPVPSSATTGPVTVTVGGVASNGVTFTVTYAPRVNAGGGAFTDGSGNSWAADQSYSAANLWGYTAGSPFSTVNGIANTTDDALYQTERFGNFGYKFDVANGRYNVTLLFAEIYSGTSGPNQRIFNVSIEGQPVLTNYDIAADVGFETAVAKTFPGILVQDGQLNIDLVTVVNGAKISAIQVLPDQPAKLGFGAINGGNPPTAGSQFPVVVQSQDSFGNPVNVGSATGVSVALQSGTGVLTPTTLTGTITAGTSEVTLSNASYSKAENGVILRATRTSGDNLIEGDSAPFAVVASSPTKLGFITQPGNTSAGNALPGPPVVAVQDDWGNTVTSSTAQITVAIGSNPGSGTLTGTAQRNAVSGTGNFADLRISQPGNGYTLTASSPGLTGATSSSFDLVAGGTISGTVTRTGTGAPIGGASIEALQSGVLKRTASTNGSGAYAMTGLPVGTYDVRVNASGYVSQSQNGVSVTGGGTATSNFTLTATTLTAGIVYIYDELQRLKSVIDPVGEAASYSYDAVGNLLNITRNNSSQTSIVDFNPNGGPVGSGVTIYGTGYSATPGQNSVTFNGVPATVISSTLTQIVTTVPAGATTGPIVVTSPAGMATSGTGFTVTGALVGAPTIASFTPTVGVAGTSVAITGTNYDADPTKNTVRFKNTLASVASSSSTTINTNFPASGQSGKISVSTQAGTAVSDQDFFMVPTPYVATDVELTAIKRIVIGGSNQTVSIATPTKIGLAVFDGNVGQKLNLAFTDNTFGSGGSSYTIYRPDGSTLASGGVSGTDTAVNFQLPLPGTYTIAIDPSASLTGSLTLTLSEELNVGTLVADTPATATLRMGQRAYATFDGNQGQQFSIELSNVTVSSSLVTILRPGGAITLTSATIGTAGGLIYTNALPQTGTYTVLIDPSNAYDGNLTLTLRSLVNLTSIYTGKIRDRVGQGDTALSADGSMDGTFTVSLPAGSGSRTVTSLVLQRNGGGGSGEWDTQTNVYWVLGAASGLDATLYNAANAAVNFSVADGGSFVVFASDGSNLFNSGASFVISANFADGITGRGNVTLPLTLTYSGKIRDRVGQGAAALTADGSMDGTFHVSFPVGSGSRTVTSIVLQRSAGGLWDTNPGGNWALGAASSLDASLYNAADSSVNFPVADAGSFNVFASDAVILYFGSGASFTLTVNFADGSTGTGNVTLP